MKCVACLQGFLWECRYKGECNDDAPLADAVAPVSLDPNHAIGFGVGVDPDPESFRTYKDDSALVDQQSTGRKRAAKLYPLDPNAACEWQQQKNCGGGSHPITGCTNGLQQARHHGPDKNTLNNERGNVHRICHTCHNRWHTLNDEGYVWGGIHEAHAPASANIIELSESEVFWKGRATVRAKD